jgi:hypothetical protein
MELRAGGDISRFLIGLTLLSQKPALRCLLMDAFGTVARAATALQNHHAITGGRKSPETKKRDRHVSRHLRKNGWKVLRIRECQLKTPGQFLCLIKKLG